MGRKIDLEAGLLEITFQSGASVVLQGPASFEVGANGGFLSLGRLTGRLGARAKTPDSRVVRQPMPAFSIRTPSAIVTDLGTEFGVEVDKDQQTFSYVFHGSVKLHPVAAAGGNEDMVLKRHEGARVALALGKSRLVERVAIEPGRFARRVRPTAMPIAVAGTGVNVEAKQPGATWLPDQNWEVVASTGDLAFQAGPARVLDVPKLDWPINLPGRAKWISPCGAWYLFKPSGLTYTFRTTFEIDDGLSETAVLRGAYFVDKEVRAIHLNGVELPLAEVVVEPAGADRPRFDWEKVAEPFRLKIERGFVEGTNTLEFTIQNSDAVGNRDTPLSSFGFCLDLKGSVQLQP
jgi:hypothetical protein